MEAMAIGLPVITTDIPENQALIKNNISGILVPTQDSKAITQAINILTLDEGLSNTLGKNGKIEILKHHELTRVAIKLAHFFNIL